MGGNKLSTKKTLESIKSFEIGKIIYLEGHVFYCPKCDQRYDHAILYDDYPNKPSCRKCSSDMEIKESMFRFGIWNSAFDEDWDSALGFRIR